MVKAPCIRLTKQELLRTRTRQTIHSPGTPPGLHNSVEPRTLGRRSLPDCRRHTMPLKSQPSQHVLQHEIRTVNNSFFSDRTFLAKWLLMCNDIMVEKIPLCCTLRMKHRNGLFRTGQSDIPIQPQYQSPPNSVSIVFGRDLHNQMVSRPDAAKKDACGHDSTLDHVNRLVNKMSMVLACPAIQRPPGVFSSGSVGFLFGALVKRNGCQDDLRVEERLRWD